MYPPEVDPHEMNPTAPNSAMKVAELSEGYGKLESPHNFLRDLSVEYIQNRVTARVAVPLTLQVI